MSADEKRSSSEPVIEQKTRVKVTRNAKGDPQWEVTIVEGTHEDEVARVRSLAVQTHRALVSELIEGKAAADPAPAPAGPADGDDEPGPAS